MYSSRMRTVRCGRCTGGSLSVGSLFSGGGGGQGLCLGGICLWSLCPVQGVSFWEGGFCDRDPVGRMIDACKNITLPQTSFAG